MVVAMTIQVDVECAISGEKRVGVIVGREDEGKSLPCSEIGMTWIPLALQTMRSESSGMER
jgi:hypothetical protein